MVADAMAPAGQAHIVIDVARAERAAGMAAIAVHCRRFVNFVAFHGTRKAHASRPLSRRAWHEFLVAGLDPATGWRAPTGHAKPSRAGGYGEFRDGKGTTQNGWRRRTNDDRRSHGRGT